MKPIDADVFRKDVLEDIEKYGYGTWTVLRCLNRQPTVHVPVARESVVRCRDCALRGDLYRCPMRTLVMPGEGPGSIEDNTTDDGFCHLGKHR